MIVFDLPPNKTFVVRKAIFKEKSPGLGILTIAEFNPYNNKKQNRRYAVYELAPVEDGRQFRITKPESDGGGFYFVLISKHQADHDHCDCRNYDYKSTCLHCQSVRQIILRGGLKVALVGPETSE